jgi:hypothetical protein
VIEWTEALIVGDTVARATGGWQKNYEIGRVVRMTKTQIVVSFNGDESRYRRDSGYPVGRGISLRPVTDEVRETIERRALEDWFWEVQERVRRVEKPVPLAALRAMRDAYAAAALDEEGRS